MREALAIVAEQGLDSMWKRHTEMGKYLWAGLNEIGLEPYVQDPADRLITVNTIRVPKDIDAVKLIKFAMDKFSLEISAGGYRGPFHSLFWMQLGVAGSLHENPWTIYLCCSFKVYDHYPCRLVVSRLCSACQLMTLTASRKRLYEDVPTNKC